MKIKIEIKHWVTGAILFEFEKENNTLLDTIQEANLQEANLQGANLREANLWGANLQEANLQGANLREANLQGANLQGANLQEANLQGANLQGANLQGANLWGANLWGANLRGADLQGANLWGANLWGANLRGADLQGAKNIDSDLTNFWWHIHHNILVEQLNEPLRARINYIKKEKPKDEVELRLKLLKPVLGKIPSTQKGWEKLHKKECKNCPWDGNTILKDNGDDI